MDELNRRIAAAMQLRPARGGYPWAAVAGQRSAYGGYSRATRGRAQVVEENATAMVDALRQSQIDTLVIDPLISSHRVNET